VVAVADEQHDVEVETPRWARLARDVLVDAGLAARTEMTLLFVDESRMAELNGRFMGSEGPTDVLSFPIDGDASSASAGDEPPVLVGDVVVCPAVAARNARTHHLTIEDELALLVVHGTLHLLGLDHAEPAEGEAMRARERALLERFNTAEADGPGVRR
jgi:probable rRNA maturation factor